MYASLASCSLPPKSARVGRPRGLKAMLHGLQQVSTGWQRTCRASHSATTHHPFLADSSHVDRAVSVQVRMMTGKLPGGQAVEVYKTVMEQSLLALMDGLTVGIKQLAKLAVDEGKLSDAGAWEDFDENILSKRQSKAIKLSGLISE